MGYKKQGSCGCNGYSNANNNNGCNCGCGCSGGYDCSLDNLEEIMSEYEDVQNQVNNDIENTMSSLHYALCALHNLMDAESNRDNLAEQLGDWRVNCSNQYNVNGTSCNCKKIDNQVQCLDNQIDNLLNSTYDLLKQAYANMERLGCVANERDNGVEALFDNCFPSLSNNNGCGCNGGYSTSNYNSGCGCGCNNGYSTSNYDSGCGCN